MRLFPCSVLDTREAYLVIRTRLARHARKAGRVGIFIFASRACRARLACLAHDSRTTNEEGGLFQQPARIFSCLLKREDPEDSSVAQ
jgi:hypothetical protein